MNKSYIFYDLAGYPFNSKYPPKGTPTNGNLYHGYDTAAQECLLYDFAVLGYDLMVKYHGQCYYFMTDDDCVWLSDSSFCAMKQRYENGNDALEQFMIEGKPLICIVDELEDYEAM